jgi:transposase
MAKIYIVRLTKTERSDLENIIHTGKIAAHKRLHAQILLKSDVGEYGESWTDKKISEAFGMTTRTVERVRQRLVEQGLEAALNRAKHSRTRSRVIDGEVEAHLIALQCSEPPKGRARWTLRLLADQLVELKRVETVSHEAVRQALKKML